MTDALLQRLADTVELKSRGAVSFKWRGEHASKGHEAYVQAFKDCLDRGMSESDAIEMVAHRIYIERRGHTSDGMKLSR